MEKDGEASFRRHSVIIRRSFGLDIVVFGDRNIAEMGRGSSNEWAKSELPVGHSEMAGW